MDIPDNGYIYCGCCTRRSEFVGTDPLKAAENARRQGFEWRMVHSGPEPKYRWECVDCRDHWAKLLFGDPKARPGQPQAGRRRGVPLQPVFLSVVVTIRATMQRMTVMT